MQGGPSRVLGAEGAPEQQGGEQRERKDTSRETLMGWARGKE